MSETPPRRLHLTICEMSRSGYACGHRDSTGDPGWAYFQGCAVRDLCLAIRRKVVVVDDGPGSSPLHSISASHTTKATTYPTAPYLPVSAAPTHAEIKKKVPGTYPRTPEPAKYTGGVLDSAGQYRATGTYVFAPIPHKPEATCFSLFWLL